MLLLVAYIENHFGSDVTGVFFFIIQKNNDSYNDNIRPMIHFLYRQKRTCNFAVKSHSTKWTIRILDECVQLI